MRRFAWHEFALRAATGLLIIGLVACSAAAAPPAPAPAPKVDPDRALAEAAVKKFYPNLLTAVPSPSTSVVYVLVEPGGKLLDASQGGLTAYDDLKLRNDRTNADVGSIRIVQLGASGNGAKPLEVAIVRLRR